MVPGEGVEPSLPCGNWILNPARLPIPPSGQQGIKMIVTFLFCKNRVSSIEDLPTNLFNFLFYALKELNCIKIIISDNKIQ